MKAGWEVKTLGEVASFQRGLTYKKADEVPHSNNRILRANNIDKISGSLNLKDIRYIKDDINIPDSKKIRQGSLLICTASGSKSHLGKIALINVNDDYAFGGFMGQIVPENWIHPKYLYWFTQSDCYRKFIDNLTDGTNINNLRFNQLSELQVPLPPLEEQKRIVSILDEAFEGLDRARENAEANLKSARELFANLLNATFESNNEQWTHSNLGAACQFIGGSQPPKANFTSEDGEGLIRLVQIRDYKSDKNITFIPRSLARRFCTANDVMIGRYGPPLFQILRGIEGAYNVALMKAEPNPELLSKDYLYFFLRNGRILKYIIDASNRAAGQIGLNKATIEPYPISYPNLAEQSRIVAELKKAEIHCKSLETKYRTKLQDISDLRQSLLQKAFAGELT